MKSFNNTVNFKFNILLLTALFCVIAGLTSAFAQVNKPVKGIQPMPGKWKAIVSNGYKGDVITFTVKPGGKIIENVEFAGYWRASGRTEVLVDLDPPGTFQVTNGLFSEVKQVPKSGMWWEFIGIFKTTTTAEGSYRAAFSGGASDTYKLKWEAKRIGS